MVEDKLSLTTKLFYASGDIYGISTFNIINFLYTVFLTDILFEDAIYLLIFLYSANTFLTFVKVSLKKHLL